MGWRNGVIKVAFTLIGGIVGLVLAGRLWSDVAEVLPIDNDSVAKIAAFVLILAVVMIAAAIAAKIITTILRIVLLGWVDGLAGLAIGSLLGAIAATAVVSAAGIVPSDSVQEAVGESTLAEPLIENMDIVFALLPEEFDDVNDLFSTGKDLLDKSATLLEDSGKLQDLIEQSPGLLEAAGGVDALLEQASALMNSEGSVLVGFTGLEEFNRDTIYALFADPNGKVVGGVLSATVLPNGVAVLAVDGLGNSAHEMIWYIDGNNNGACDDTNTADAKATMSLPAGTLEVGQEYLPAVSQHGQGLCDRF